MSKKNIKRIFIGVSIIVAILLIRICTPETPPPPPKKALKDNLNITLFLDLSDHLDTTKASGNSVDMGKYRFENFISIAEKFGKYYIKLITESSKRLNTYDEKIHLRTHPVADFPNVNEYLIDFKLNKNTLGNYVKTNESVIPTSLKNSVNNIFIDCAEKYNNNHNGGYPGSNIYSYFQKKDFYIHNNKNLLIIFTDGYPYHDHNKQHKDRFFLENTLWKRQLHNKDLSEIESLFEADSTLGLKKATENLKNLRVLIIGTQPKGANPVSFEKDLMTFLWSDWLQKMGVEEHNVKLLFMEDCTNPKLESTFNWLLTAQWP